MHLLNNELTSLILKTYYEVYNELGYGFLEKVYQNALLIELKNKGLEVTPNKKIKVYYKGENVGDYYADIIVSNCVLNLVPNKHKVISEIYRVLKPGGHFSISDIVLEGELPAKWKEVAELYAGCVSGAIQREVYLEIIASLGFKNITLQKDKPIIIPDTILANYLSAAEIATYKNGKTKITSITVYAEKPAKDERNCCEPGSGCC